MLKIALLTSLFALTFSPVALNNDAPFKPIHDIKALPNIDDEAPILSGLHFDDVQLTTGAPGGGSPSGARYIRYSFVISYTNLNYLQDFDMLFISLPYEAEKNNLTDLKMEIRNTDNTNVYSNIEFHSLSVAMLYNFGMTLPDNPIFMGKNFLDIDLMDNYREDYIKIAIEIPINYFPPQWMEHTIEKTNFYSSLPNNDYAYENGYTNGYIDGNNIGMDNGYNVGYNDGYNIGLTADFDSFGWLTAIFTGMGSFLNIQLLPGVSIGGIAILIMVLTLVPFLIGLLKGGKS